MRSGSLPEMRCAVSYINVLCKCASGLIKSNGLRDNVLVRDQVLPHLVSERETKGPEATTEGMKV